MSNVTLILTKAVDPEANSSRHAECLVVSIFFSPDNGLLVYDSYARGEIYSKLISVRIPYHFFVTKGRMVEGSDQSLEYVGYQVPRTDLEASSSEADKGNQEFLFYSGEYFFEVNFLFWLGYFSCH